MGLKDDTYEAIIKIIRKELQDKNHITIKELIASNYLAEYEYENIIALLKFLLASNFLISNNHFSVNDFENNIIGWNKEKDDIIIPKRKSLTFDTTRLCITFPPFNTSSLLSHMKTHSIIMNSLLDEFTNLFSRATFSIKICSPFLEYDGFEYFKDLLIQKAKQRVSIQILSRQIKLGEKFTRYDDIKEVYNCFLREGVESFLNIRNYYYQSKDNKLVSGIHAKLIIIDDTLAYIGSGEVRKNSFERNLEIGVILTGSKVSELSMIFNKLFSKSEVIDFI